MKQLFKKTILLALIAALGLAAMPFVSVSAAGAKDPSTPPQVTNERLENIWARQLRAYERMSHTDEFIAKTQKLIDRANENGKDISAVQAALDAFAAQVKEAHPIYESAKGIINSHQGLDENGKVTDPEKAKETIKAFREANPRPEKTSTPAGG